MLDMGFEPQIKKILLDIRPDRQTVMTRYLLTSCCSAREGINCAGGGGDICGIVTV